MEIQVSENWKIAIKWVPLSKCANFWYWLLFFRNYNSVTNRYGFEVRLLGFGFGCMSRPY